MQFYEEQGWKQISTDEAAVPPYHVYRYDIEGNHGDFERLLIGSVFKIRTVTAFYYDAFLSI